MKLNIIKHKLPLIALLFTMAACTPALKPADLYGTWKYTKVANPNQTPPDSVSHFEIERQAPNINFTKADSLIITWGGKVLSKGKFTIDGKNIQYTEDIPGGKRTFPFYVSQISD